MKKRILLADDDAANLDVMRTELVFLGYEVIMAKNGDEAVEMAAAELPALIIMDIAMPGMNGLEAASRIRKDPKTQTTPILAATAKAMPGDETQCLSAGCDAYIAKPFTHRQLGAAIKKLLGE